jgi:hypothetical protein
MTTRQRVLLREFQPPATAQEIRVFLSHVLVEVRSGQLPEKAGNALAQIAGVLLRALNDSDFESRLAAVERALEQRGHLHGRLKRG